MEGILIEILKLISFATLISIAMYDVWIWNENRKMDEFWRTFKPVGCRLLPHLEEGTIFGENISIQYGRMSNESGC